jgi:uncharacterized protein
MWIGFVVRMPFQDPPGYAAWQHRHARSGFEVVFVRFDGDGYRLEGTTAAVEDEKAWAVQYVIALTSDWVTRSARVSGRASPGSLELTLESDGAGRWWINGEAAAYLDGCLDVDLESSALTNAFPVHRLALDMGDHCDAPAAYVRALDLGVERLDQRYMRLNDDGKRERYRYTAPEFGFQCELVYDEFGFVLDYPGLATRVA